jgi:hypothetical protein
MFISVLALGTGYTKRISSTQLYIFRCSLLSSGTTFFYIFLKQQDIRDIFTAHKISFDFLYKFSDILSWMFTGLHVRNPLLLSVLINLNFFNVFSSNSQIPNFVKILPVGTELFHADGRTDRETDRQTHTPTNTHTRQWRS